MALTSGFHRTNDADLLRDNQRGWPVLEGKNIHQFNHAFARHQFSTSMSAGLKRAGRKRVYGNDSRAYHHSFRLAFRSISSPTNMRTVISAIIPPQVFHTHSMCSAVLRRHGRLVTDNDYNRHISYLCGVFNSMPFDYVARSKVQMNVAPVIGTIPIPNDMSHYDSIAELAARMSVGTDTFEGFAESLRLDNVRMSPPERIRATARLDALIAHSYGLSADQYQTILESFRFAENPGLLEAESADLRDNITLRQFYGEVRKLAPTYYDVIAGRIR